MDTTKIAIMVMGSIASLGILAGGLGFLMSKFKSGSKEEKEGLISSSEKLTEFWKSQSEGYKIMMEAKDEKWRLESKEKDEKYRQEMQSLTREVGELRGQLNAEKSTNERLEKIFQGRNPEMEEFMKFMIQATTNQTEGQKAILEVLEEIKKMSLEEKTRELHLEGTVSKT